MANGKKGEADKGCSRCSYHAAERWHNELNVPIKIIKLGPEPTLSERLSAAHYVAARNIADVGITTKKQLMWPKMQFTNNDVVSFAAWLLASAQAAALQVLPRHAIDSLSTDLNEHLSFLCDTVQQDDSHRDQDK